MRAGLETFNGERKELLHALRKHFDDVFVDKSNILATGRYVGVRLVPKPQERDSNWDESVRTPTRQK